MNRVLMFAKIALCAAGAFALCAIGWCAVHAGRDADAFKLQGARQLQLLDVESAARTRLAQDLRRELACDRIGKMGKGKDAIDCDAVGAIPKLTKAIADVDDVAKAQTNLAGEVTARLTCVATGDYGCPTKGVLVELAEQLHNNGAAAKAAQDKLTAILAKVDDEENGIGPVLLEARDATHNLANLAGDKNIAAGIGSMAKAAEHTATATGNMADASADVKDQVHRWTHPKGLTTAANWFLKVVHALGGFF